MAMGLALPAAAQFDGRSVAAPQGPLECGQGSLRVGAIRRGAERAERSAHRRERRSQVGRAISIALPARARARQRSRERDRRRGDGRPDLPARTNPSRRACAPRSPTSASVCCPRSRPRATRPPRPPTTGASGPRPEGQFKTVLSLIDDPDTGGRLDRPARAHGRVPRAQRARRGAAAPAAGRTEAGPGASGRRAACRTRPGRAGSGEDLQRGGRVGRGPGGRQAGHSRHRPSR